ncbi:MAG: hypothetical protein ACREPM_07930 [Gemmatimonadaceae bacterium]
MTRAVRWSVLVLVMAPRLIAAQFYGISIGRSSSTVDWQYPPPPANCDFCIVDASPNASRVALAPAVAAQWRADRWVGIASEARFIQKGYAVTGPTLNVDYVEAPLLMRLGKLVDPRTPLTMFGEAGPALAVRVYCAVYFTYEPGDCGTKNLLTEDWRVRAFDISGITGAGVALHVGDNLVTAGARVDWGFVDINRSDGVPTKNRSYVGYVAWLWKW